MFNFYRTTTVVQAVGIATFKDFTSAYADKRLLVTDEEMMTVEFNAWLKPFRDQLGDVDIEQVIRVSQTCHDFAHSDIISKRNQEKFLSFCKFDFGVCKDLELKIIAQLETVKLKRIM
jgi:hypothetical protein